MVTAVAPLTVPRVNDTERDALARLPDAPRPLTVPVSVRRDVLRRRMLGTKLARPLAAPAARVVAINDSRTAPLRARLHDDPFT
jgi:hypothetical protein